MQYAGLDRSGIFDLAEQKSQNEICGVGITAVENMNSISAELRHIRHQYYKSEDAEIHGRETNAQIQVAGLEACIRCRLRVGILIIDKEATRQEHYFENPPSSTSLMRDTALYLVEQFAQKHLLGRLWCDEDVRSKEWQKEFDTAVKRIYRARWGDIRLKIRHCPSDKSDLVQLADLCLYCFVRYLSGGKLEQEVIRLLNQIQRDEQNLILGPVIWKGIEDT